MALIVHSGKLVRGEIHAGEQCVAEVDLERRTALARAHSATHLLHHALHLHVGRHAEQQGSKVEADRLRFDFNNPKAIPDETLVAIEEDVSKLIQASEAIVWETVPLEQARQVGAMMLFGKNTPIPAVWFQWANSVVSFAAAPISRIQVTSKLSKSWSKRASQPEPEGSKH